MVELSGLVVEIDNEMKGLVRPNSRGRLSTYFRLSINPFYRIVYIYSTMFSINLTKINDFKP